jgi:hypothetical protein
VAYPKKESQSRPGRCRSVLFPDPPRHVSGTLYSKPPENEKRTHSLSGWVRRHSYLTSQECLVGHPTFCLGNAASGNGVAAPDRHRHASFRFLKRASTPADSPLQQPAGGFDVVLRR